MSTAGAASAICPPARSESASRGPWPRLSLRPGTALSRRGVRAALGAVQEHRGDEGGGFLDAGYVLRGHAGRGLEQLAEQEEQFGDGEVAAERAVVEAALQQRPEQCVDLLFRVAGG